MKRQVTLFIMFGTLIVLLLAGSLLLAPGEAVLSAPPPLPTMTPVPPPVQAPAGAVIALRVKPTDVQMWTVVQ